MPSRGKTPIVIQGDRRMKVCACKALFPVEYNNRGQMTSRALCDKCREKRLRRRADDLPDTEGVPRCVECTALVGLQWGTVTHLDAGGRCQSCAAWHAKRVLREVREGMGYRLAAGILFRGPIPFSRPSRPRRHYG
jgi:hypothetical protein